MRVLITNCILCTRSGTETYVRDLALGLQAAGHRPMVFSPVLGKIAWEISSAGIPVAREPRDLPRAPDIIHGHHHPDTALALRRFPETPAIYVCHAWRGILKQTRCSSGCAP